MGESISSQLSQSAGLTGLANWLDSGFRTPILEKFEPGLRIVQSLRPFQRRFRIQENQVGVAVAGNQATHSVEVPVNEGWRIHWIKVFQSDSVGVDYSLFVTRLSPINEVIRIVHWTIPNNEAHNFYPGRQITIVQNNSDYTHPAPLEVFTGDTVRVTSDPFTTAGRISRVAIRYELIPSALDFEAGPEWTGAEI